MPLYLTEDEVGALLSMEACITAVEEILRQWAAGQAANRPRTRAAARGMMLHVLPAASRGLGRMAAKVYGTTRTGARFLVLLFDGRSAALLALLEGDRLGRIRTGAASAVATRRLARPDARALGIIGTGRQARSQIEAMAQVRALTDIRVYGRDRGRLQAFCDDVAAAHRGVAVRSAASPREAVSGADIVVTATTSPEPVLEGSWVGPGTHINAIGSNRIDRRELDAETVRRAGLIVVDSLEQARMEAGDLAGCPGAFERAVELPEIVVGRHPGRRDTSQVTLFKSVGIGLEDLAAASLVYDLAVASGVGSPLPGDGPRGGL
jgi:alanine dehydrogenase